MFVMRFVACPTIENPTSRSGFYFVKGRIKISFVLLMAKLTPKKRPTDKNLSEIPNQLGAYLLHRGDNPPYVGSAGAGNLQKRVKQQLNQKRGVTSIRYKPTSSEREARNWEEKYRDKYNPKQKHI